MMCAFIVMKCEGFSQITDLVDYLDNTELKTIMADLVRQLYELGVVDASFIGLDSTPVMANTKQNNPKSFVKNKFSKEHHPKSDPDCALGVHSASNQHNERRYEFYWGCKSHVLVDCISGLPLYELTTPTNIMDSTVAADILAAANQILPIRECIFLADKGYDVRDLYNTVRDVYDGEAVIPLNKRSTKKSKKLAAGNPICEAGLAMSKDGRRLMDMVGSTRNSAAVSGGPRQPAVPVTTKNGTTGRKSGAAPNIRSFLLVTTLHWPSVSALQKDLCPAYRIRTLQFPLQRNRPGTALDP